MHFNDCVSLQFNTNSELNNFSGSACSGFELQTSTAYDVDMVKETLLYPLSKISMLFYGVNPNQTFTEKIADVPNYITEAYPCLALLFILEQIVAFLKGKPLVRINDGIVCISQGIFFELARLTTYGVQCGVYSYVYENWRLFSLPWDSLWTWWISFLILDFSYYWLHRACHAINLFWATHHAHHSSEEFNLTVATRVPIAQYILGMIYYLPLAFIMPPSTYYVHVQLNLMFQFWLHTKVIGSLGFIEYIINTPSLHSVHHGRNKYCIDKNFGGVLMIWDCMFGTFEKEKEEVFYGTTVPIQTFQLLQIQFSHFAAIWKRFREVDNVKEKLSVLFKGPGWAPGKPWLGNLEDIPEVHKPIEKYNVKVPLWFNFYGVLHITFLILSHLKLMGYYKFVSFFAAWTSIGYEILSVITLCALFNGRWHYATWLELSRCILFLTVDYYVLPVKQLSLYGLYFSNQLRDILQTSFLLSTVFWGWMCMKTISVHFYSKKID